MLLRSLKAGFTKWRKIVSQRYDIEKVALPHFVGRDGALVLRPIVRARERERRRNHHQHGGQ
jgi:hypothetical protein